MRSISRSSVYFFCAIAFFSICAGLPILINRTYFIGDDFGLIQLLHDKPLIKFFSYFISDWTEGIYGFKLDELRPVLAMSYRIDSALLGAANPVGYHLTNLLLHLLSSLAVGMIAVCVTRGNRRAGLLAALLFTLAPCHSEPIAWISGRVDSLTGIFYLYAFLFFILFRLRGSYGYYLGSLFLFVLGLFTKQYFIVFPFILLAYDLFYHRGAPQYLPGKRPIPLGLDYLPFFLFLALYLVLRMSLFDNAIRENVLRPYTLREFLLYRQMYYLRALLLPLPLDLNAWTQTMKNTVGLSAIIIGLTSFLWVFRRFKKNRDYIRHFLFFGLIWYFINISPMIVTYRSARHLYVTSAGVCIVLALFLMHQSSRQWSKRERYIRMFAIAGILVLNWTTLYQNISPWIKNGIRNRKAATEIPRLLKAVPPGSTIVITIPAVDRDVWLWSWSLPFTLQEPFASHDIYNQYKFLETEYVYCCPLEQWWTDKQPAILSLMEGPRPEKILYILDQNKESGSMTLRKKIIIPDSLRKQMEKIMGKPLTNDVREIHQKEAVDLLEVLKQ